MNPQPDNVEALRKLLALKRYELPPPGFFQTFSTRVIHRLEQLESSRPRRWWQCLALPFDFKPALICACGVVVCGLFSAGVIASTQWNRAGQFAGSALASPMASSSWAEPTESAMVANRRIPASTEPVLSSPNSPFNQFQVRATRASFNLR